MNSNVVRFCPNCQKDTAHKEVVKGWPFCMVCLMAFPRKDKNNENISSS